MDIILTTTDTFTRYTELVAIPDKKTTTAKELLDQWILRHGFYEQVISTISPQIDGQVEGIHQTMGDYLKTYCDNPSAEWTNFLSSLRFALNTRVHSSTKISPYFTTYWEHPMLPWSQNQHLSYSESKIASRILPLQHAPKLISENSEEAKAASKRAYDIETTACRLCPGDDALFHFTDPPKGTNRKIYKLKRKGGKIKATHINHIKYYDPEKSDSDTDTRISNEEDEEAETQPTQPTGPTTRSRDNTLPPPTNKFTAIVNTQHDEVTHIAKQPPMDLTSLWESNNTSTSNSATFATEFMTLFAQNHTNSAP